MAANPNLTGLVRLLRESYDVDVTYIQLRRIKSDSEFFFHVGVRLLQFFYLLSQIELKYLSSCHLGFVLRRARLLKRSLRKCHALIGVDHEGILIAEANLSAYQKLSMISYEIMFQSETPRKFKHRERDACSSIVVAITQDDDRRKHLAAENDIGLEKIITIPMTCESGRIFQGAMKNNKKRVAIVIGSTQSWNMIREIVASFPQWPEYWNLILHDRYGSFDSDRWIANNASLASCADRIQVSSDVAEKIEDLNIVLSKADVALAFYQETYESRFTGLNIKHIGLSSGKIATYLAHSVPVITNDIALKDYLVDYKAGVFIEDLSELAGALEGDFGTPEGARELHDKVFTLERYENEVDQFVKKLRSPN